MKNGIALARWLASRAEVSRVIHPALESHPDHAIWKRDFLGASGLFSIVLKPCTETALAAMLDEMELFGMGYSWGGYESLIIPQDLKGNRTVTPAAFEGRSEEHTSELQSLMRISYAVFCLKKQTQL